MDNTEAKIFLGGSQTLTALPDMAKTHLDKWMAEKALLLVGDCKGADRLMQAYLHEKGYENVFVFVSGDEIRCNEGAWEVIHCHGGVQPHTYEYYKVKDRAMANTADEALMLWDGKSPGTRENIIDMRQQEKPVTFLRMEEDGCREEFSHNAASHITDRGLEKELKRYGNGESTCIAAAIHRCPRAKEDLHLQKDELFMLQRMRAGGMPDPESPAYRPFLSFTDVLEAIRDEMISRDPAQPKPYYKLEKWSAKWNFNLTFFRFREELIEVEPPEDDYHMVQTAVFYLDGDEVVSYHQLP